MKPDLTAIDCDVILESLKYTKFNFENYEKYPSHEYKQKKIAKVDEVMAKVSALKKSLNTNKSS